MTTKDPNNYYITQEMIVRAEQNHYWKHISEDGKQTLALGGKVTVGVTEIAKIADFDNWLAKAEQQQK